MPPSGDSPSLEDMVQQLAVGNIQFQQNMNATIQDLKTQIGQTNASAISLRSGKALPEPALQQLPRSTEVDPESDANSWRPLQDKTVPLPFPTQTISTRKLESDEELLKMFQKVEINIPLLDAIKQIPKYAKFLKELCVHKRKKMRGSVQIGGIVSTLTRSEDSTTGAQPLPKKCRDLRIFSVPCTIGNCTFANSMLDLGASINVMPTSIYKSLNFGDLEPTGMTIQLANRSVVEPLGVLEDVLVQVNELIFPVDFCVLDMEDETSGKGSTLILGRPFLMIAKTKIDVHVGTLSMEFGDTLVQFNIFEAMKHPTEDHSLFGIDLIKELFEECFQLDNNNEEIENLAKDVELIDCPGSLIEESDYDEVWEVHNLSNFEDDNIDLADLSQEAKLIKITGPMPNPTQVDQSDLKVSIDNSSSPPPPMELKPLPSHLKYAYLDAEQQLLVIIASNLCCKQEDKLLSILRQHKKVIGWKLFDLLGINPSSCMHRILMEEESKPIRQQQRRMNPTILDMVKKEVTKLLAAGIIYPISDSQWVSPMQVVPKKSRMTTTKNQHDELNSWQVFIDYRRLNQATCKDHFPLPFLDQVLEKLAGKSHYCFLDGFSRYMQIHIAPEDQHKTTFTCPFGTFAYTRMPFGL
ncbi:Retrovirus-related Pol polyprotein, partial [Mucuna pruriens]